jgi:hypothetical protein
MLLELRLGDVDTKVVNIETPNLVLIHISNSNPRINVQKTIIIRILRLKLADLDPILEFFI